ncbi:MAG: Redox-sensitive bicupin YhaK, pirin superfamily [Acidobacteria bacterium]|nr:Redox-sensitive bicupin YhaK, pirin superfamily [Acidobacteriota bacterium]
MTEAHARTWPTAFAARPRKITRRTRGNRHGPITRLMSPSDLGQVLKPFVFLDLFDMQNATFQGMGLHPHSGIATVSYLFEGATRYEDSAGATGVLPAGGVEWFKAGHGAWHGGGLGDAGRARGFQLWLALPPDHELGPVENVCLAPDAVARDGPARVLVGTHGGATSSINAPASLNYLAVRLLAGQSWRYRPAVDHTVGWVSVSTGRLRVPENVEAGELAIFESSTDAIDFHADTDSDFVLGSAVPHGYDLVLGQSSVHTSAATLRTAEHRLREIQQRLQNEGQL